MFYARALSRISGIAVATGSSFLNADHEPYPAIRVSLGSVTEDQLRSGVATLASILRAPPEPPLPTSL
jgi:DNA-binding transcriptional MocR family regulator